LERPQVSHEVFDSHAARSLRIAGTPILPTPKQTPPNRHFPVLVQRLELASVNKVANVGSTESAAVSLRKKCEVCGTTSEFSSARTPASSVVSVALCAIADEISLSCFDGGIGRFKQALKKEAGNASDSNNKGQPDEPCSPAIAVHHGLALPTGSPRMDPNDGPSTIRYMSPDRPG
jgi:hypothetical protein